MARFISRDKLSKKARRTLDAQSRKTWPFPPVQRTVESQKRYDRKKSAHAWKKDSGMGAFSVIFVFGIPAGRFTASRFACACPAPAVTDTPGSPA